MNALTRQRLEELYRARDNANRQILTLIYRTNGTPAAVIEAAEIHRQMAVERYRDHPKTLAMRRRLLTEDAPRHVDPRHRRTAA